GRDVHLKRRHGSPSVLDDIVQNKRGRGRRQDLGRDFRLSIRARFMEVTWNVMSDMRGKNAIVKETATHVLMPDRSHTTSLANSSLASNYRDPGSAREGSRGEGQGRRRAPQELAEEVQGTAPLLPACPPHRHQHRLRPRPGPGAAATPDLAQDDPE